METEPDVHTLASLGECRRQLGLDERDDSLTLFLLIAATYTVENHCRRCLLRKDIREYFDSAGYDLAEVPADLKQAILDALRLLLTVRNRAELNGRFVSNTMRYFLIMLHYLPKRGIIGV